jgi:hypothetical protein
MFVSYNLDDAKEKIRIIHKIVELSPALRRMADFKLLAAEVRVRPRWSRQWSTIRSLPCRPVRGKTKADLYLDEIAHYADPEDVYLGSVPATVRAGASAGQITVASTPNGRQGVFWECVEGMRARPYWQQLVPWWVCRYLCLDVEAAAEHALAMPTEERVRKYGAPNLVELFEGMTLIDFQQEFEAAFLDDGQTYYPLDLIQDNQVHGTSLCLDLTEVDKRRHPEGQIFAGVDIGRFKDTTELVLVDRFPDDTASTGYAYRVMLIMTMDRVDTQRQGDEFLRLLARDDGEFISHLFLDMNGIGLPIGERLAAAWSKRVTGVNFTAGAKEAMAVLVRRGLERRLIDLPDPEHCLGASQKAMRMRQAREFQDQIHSIKRTALQGKHARYEAESTTHHGDQFWGFALAMLCAAQDLKPPRSVDEARGEHYERPQEVDSEEV